LFSFILKHILFILYFFFFPITKKNYFYHTTPHRLGFAPAEGRGFAQAQAQAPLRKGFA
jgi:hypothetical protein